MTGPSPAWATCPRPWLLKNLLGWHLSAFETIQNPPPTLLMFLPDGKHRVVPLMWLNDAHKVWLFARWGRHMRKCGVTRYAFWSEAWVATYPNGLQPGQPGFVMPAGRPDRQEVLMTVVVDKGEPPIMATRGIVRDVEGWIVDLTENPEWDDLDVAGRAATMLEEMQ